ncbi:MAG TPA: helix-turn-helix transcriptional regulator [Thermoanaerobaculia bacterium]|nr:helix-turn-helix transcriptional regulator [Thermoanaerobaculia bacterium]
MTEEHPDGELRRLLGGRIAGLRRGQGWTQKELAAKILADPSALRRYERGRAFPRLDVLVRLSAAFAVTVDHLLTGRGPKRPPDTLLSEIHGQLADLLPPLQAALAALAALGGIGGVGDSGASGGSSALSAPSEGSRPAGEALPR